MCIHVFVCMSTTICLCEHVYIYEYRPRPEPPRGPSWAGASAWWDGPAFPSTAASAPASGENPSKRLPPPRSDIAFEIHSNG